MKISSVGTNCRRAGRKKGQGSSLAASSEEKIKRLPYNRYEVVPWISAKDIVKIILTNNYVN